MKLIIGKKVNKIVPDNDKLMREINDIYKERIVDEEGNITQEEHIPYYMKEIYIPKNFTLEQAKEIYVEEKANISNDK